MKTKNWVEQISDLLSKADKIAKENGVNNLFYNEMFMELIMAAKLGHKWEAHTQGGDAIETQTKKPTEYKTIQIRSKNEGSYQFHWLSNNKMAELSQTENMFFARRDGVKILEIYKVPSKKLIPLIAEKATGTDATADKEKKLGHKSFSHKAILALGGELVYKAK